ncbi:MAG: hypothetical protein NC184_02760 [Roseburia sp.]|nr:hypothetical protein [Roseburia sp.]
MKAKKIFAAVGCAALTAALSLSVAACGKGDKGGDDIPEGAKPIPVATAVDTFIGAVSSATYSNEADAVEAFFENELNGEYVGYDSKGTLPASSISALGLSDEANVKTATAIDVKYNCVKFTEEEDDGGVSASADGAYDSTFKAYMIEYNDGTFKYYSPRPENGEYLTKSYRDSFIDGSKYANCVIEITEDEQEFSEYMPDGGTSAADLEFILTREIETDVVETSSDSARMKYGEWIRYKKVGDEMQLVEDDDDDDDGEAAAFDNIYVKRGDRAFGRGSYFGNSSWNVMTNYKQVETDDDFNYGSQYYEYSAWNDALFDVVIGDYFDILNYYYFSFEKTETGFKASAEYLKLMSSDFVEMADQLKDLYFEFDVDNGTIVKIRSGAEWEEDGERVWSKGSIEIKDFGNVAAFTPDAALMTELDAYIAELDDNVNEHTVASAEAWAAAFDLSDITNYTARYWDNNLGELGERKTIMREGDTYAELKISSEGNSAKITYKDGGNWYSQTADWEEYDYVWSDLTACAAPSFGSIYGDFAEIASQFDKFTYDYNDREYDTYANSYVGVVTSNGEQYIYRVVIEDGKVKSIERISAERALKGASVEDVGTTHIDEDVTDYLR